jgi:replicative DNA helicase
MILMECMANDSNAIEFLENVSDNLDKNIIDNESVIHYVNRVKELYVLRLLKTKFAECINYIDSPLAISNEILNNIENDIYELIKDGDTYEYESVNLQTAKAEILNKINDSLSSGFNTLDELIGGLRNGNLIIVAGRPSHGKTAFALNILNKIWDANIPTGLFSIEMTKFENECRLISMRTKIDLLNLIYKEIDATQENSINEISDETEKLSNIYIDDKTFLIKDIVYKSKKMVKENGVKLIIIDYLQLVENDKVSKYGNRNLELASISRRLKQLAKELGIPIIALSQLNRDMDKRGKSEREPKLSDLRDSGALEQDADVVIFVFRADMYEEPMETEIIIAKARNAKVGKIDFEFHPDYQMFYEK